MVFVGWQSGRGRLRRFVAGESGGEKNSRCREGVRVSEGKRTKKARWVPTTTNDLLMKRIDLFSSLCLVKGNTANFFNPFFLRINWVRSWRKRVVLH